MNARNRSLLIEGVGAVRGEGLNRLEHFAGASGPREFRPAADARQVQGERRLGLGHGPPRPSAATLLRLGEPAAWVRWVVADVIEAPELGTLVVWFSCRRP